MTIKSNDLHQHVSFRFQSLDANLAIYDVLYTDFVDKFRDPIAKVNDSFFRSLFYYFLDLDSVTFSNLMHTHGEDFYRFFNRMNASSHYENSDSHTPYIKDVVVLFTKIYEHLPETWHSVVALIRLLNEKIPESSEGMGYQDSFWTCDGWDIDCRTSISPIFSFPLNKDMNASENEAFAFYSKFQLEFQSFARRMDKIPFVVWADVFNTFYKYKNDSDHFLNLMEMTEEYFNKIDYITQNKEETTEEKESIIPGHLLRSFLDQAS